MLEYTNDFLRFWAAYKPPKTASKQDAMKAWVQTKNARPPIDTMLACVQAYQSWLATETAKQGREYPKQHAATFLRKATWEGFLEDAEAILKVKLGRTAYLAADAMDERFAAIEAEIGPQAFAHWFLATTISNIDGVTWIDCPSTFHMMEMVKRFDEVIRQAFGEDVQLTVAKKNGPGS